MDLVGEMVQDLCKFLNITELQTVINFPNDFQLFEQVCSKLIYNHACELYVLLYIDNSYYCRSKYTKNGINR